jgi:hypothetical protein
MSYECKRTFNQRVVTAAPSRIVPLQTGRNELPLPTSYCQIWCLKIVGHAAIWLGLMASIPSLNVTPVMTLAR